MISDACTCSSCAGVHGAHVFMDFMHAGPRLDGNVRGFHVFLFYHALGQYQLIGRGASKTGCVNEQGPQKRRGHADVNLRNTTYCS